MGMTGAFGGPTNLVKRNDLHSKSAISIKRQLGDITDDSVLETDGWLVLGEKNTVKDDTSVILNQKNRTSYMSRLGISSK